jgi:deoxycytidylate deaminase
VLQPSPRPWHPNLFIIAAIAKTQKKIISVSYKNFARFYSRRYESGDCEKEHKINRLPFQNPKYCRSTCQADTVEWNTKISENAEHCAIGVLTGPTSAAR